MTLLTSALLGVVLALVVIAGAEWWLRRARRRDERAAIRRRLVALCERDALVRRLDAITPPRERA